ncbi:hypothetical protein JRQ81_000325 [Phrynocephalus forsythii]|uniref:Uncharacterized protein n=1 Tax=Phrynocephalus forsythii TaxID=171643 RepID=A0A9Q0Y522_9SAUR|nr:hypothetical protein JRQ81_000325 [Phrynocephalus forsythii]
MPVQEVLLQLQKPGEEDGANKLQSAKLKPENPNHNGRTSTVSQDCEKPFVQSKPSGSCGRCNLASRDSAHSHACQSLEGRWQREGKDRKRQSEGNNSMQSHGQPQVPFWRLQVLAALLQNTLREVKTIPSPYLSAADWKFEQEVQNFHNVGHNREVQRLAGQPELYISLGLPSMTELKLAYGKSPQDKYFGGFSNGTPSAAPLLTERHGAAPRGAPSRGARGTHGSWRPLWPARKGRRRSRLPCNTGSLAILQILHPDRPETERPPEEEEEEEEEDRRGQPPPTTTLGSAEARKEAPGRRPTRERNT